MGERLEVAPVWIVPDEYREATPHTTRAACDVELSVIHWTASPGADYGVRRGANEARIRRWMRGEGSRSSTHFVVLRDGVVFQAAPLSVRTWHAGAARWDIGRERGMGTSHVNARSIGVDMECVGPLTLDGETVRDCYGGVYRGPEPARARGKRYEPFTRPQVEALCSLVEALVEVLPVLGDPRRWAGHSDVAPARKSDPGPLFPWRLVREVASHAAEGQCVPIDWRLAPGTAR